MCWDCWLNRHFPRKATGFQFPFNGNPLWFGRLQQVIPEENDDDDDDDDDDDGLPAYSHHDKMPPWWGNVSNDKGGNVSVSNSHHT